MLKRAEDLQPGDVLDTAGWQRTISEVLVEGEAVTVRFTPPQDPETWEYLLDGEGNRLEQPDMVTSIHDEFEVAE